VGRVIGQERTRKKKKDEIFIDSYHGFYGCFIANEETCVHAPKSKHTECKDASDNDHEQDVEINIDAHDLRLNYKIKISKGNFMS
jgi:hypothetical protein